MTWNKIKRIQLLGGPCLNAYSYWVYSRKMHYILSKSINLPISVGPGSHTWIPHWEKISDNSTHIWVKYKYFSCTFGLGKSIPYNYRHKDNMLDNWKPYLSRHNLLGQFQFSFPKFCFWHITSSAIGPYLQVTDGNKRQWQ